MTKKAPSKKFFLLSFFPAIAYWYLEDNYPIQVAVTGGLILAVVEMGLEYLFTRHVHKISLFNFLLIAVLGGFSLFAQDGIWFRLYPAFTSLALSLILFIYWLRTEGLMWTTMKDMGGRLPPYEFWRPMEGRMIGLFALHGVLMGVLALKGATDWWVFFKTAGFFLIFIVYTLLESFLLRRKTKSLLAKRRF
jgi:intracellular septation protein